MKKISTAILILFTLAPSLHAVPFIDLNDYSGFDFSNMEVVLIEKGDNINYKEPGYNDSLWQITSLPSSWNSIYPDWSGICWYRLHIKFPAGVPRNTPGICLGTIDDVDEVFLNGELIGKTGEFPPDRVSAYDIKRIYELPAGLIKPGMDNVIAVRVAGLFPGENGPYKGRFCVSTFSDLQKDFFVTELIDLIFIVIYLAVGFYFGLVFSRGTANREHLFFSLFTLSVAFYLFLRTQIKYSITADFLMLKRIEYIILIIILLFMMEYITSFYGKRRSPLHYIYYTAVGLSLVPVIFRDDPYLWNQVLFYFIQPSWILPVVFCFYVTFREYKKEPDAKYILATFIIISIIFINDVLIERRLYDFMSLSNYGFLIVIIGTAVIMRNRFARMNAELDIFRAKKSRKPEITGETRKKFETAVAFIEENYMHDISRENFAESLGIHHDYLGKLFMQIKGKKMGEYINELRIKKAAELLLVKDASVTDIAFSVGFDSLSTFYRIFQRIMGGKPTDYREKNKHK